jgi:hypothetical protein
MRTVPAHPLGHQPVPAFQCARVRLPIAPPHGWDKEGRGEVEEHPSPEGETTMIEAIPVQDS